MHIGMFITTSYKVQATSNIPKTKYEITKCIYAVDREPLSTQFVPATILFTITQPTPFARKLLRAVF